MSGAPPAPQQRWVPLEIFPRVDQHLTTLRALSSTTQLVPQATSGVAVLADGTTRALPGLDGHRLLELRSAVLGLAHHVLREGQVYRSFLWPAGPTDDEGDHVRLTVVATHDVAPVLGVVLLTPHGQCRGLTARELEVLGLVVDGCSNQQVARRLAITPRTVATHVEHILVKLDVPSRTLAAVHAERDGCYVPAAARSRG